MKSQYWNSISGGLNSACRIMYSDTTENYLYIAGVFYEVDGIPMKGIARWNGGLWDSLKGGIDAMDLLNPSPQNTLAIMRYNGKLYVGGAFASLGNKPAKSIGTWNGTNWDTLSPQPFKTNYSSAVYSMEVIDGELYLGGIFDSIAGLPCKSFAKWDGTNFTNIGFPPTITNFNSSIFVNAICKYNGEIYIGGNFESGLYPNDTIQDIIRYDGANWKSVGGGLKGGYSQIESMTIYNNELFVAGYFTLADGNRGNSIQKWNGICWSDVGGGVSGEIHKLLVYNGKLYALGTFNIAGGIFAQNIAAWNGTNWCSLGSAFDNTILTGSTYKDSLNIGGGFLTIDGVGMNYLSKWIGGNYTDTCGNLTGVEQLNISNESFNIYPNPAQSKITIEFDAAETKNASIEIKNILGKTVKAIDNMPFSKGKNKIEIDVSRFSKGLYFVQLQNGNKMLYKKFVKE